MYQEQENSPESTAGVVLSSDMAITIFSQGRILGILMCQIQSPISREEILSLWRIRQLLKKLFPLQSWIVVP